MEIQDVTIDWMLKYGNNPIIEVHVDKLPPLQDLLYTVHKNRSGYLYVAYHESGYVSYMQETPSNPTGSSGRTHTVKLYPDGEEREIVGPWSSRAECVNSQVVHPIVDVTFLEKRGSYTSRVPGGMEYYALLKALKKFQPGLKLKKAYNGNFWHYYVPKEQYYERSEAS